MQFLIALQSHNKSNSQDNYQPWKGFKFKRYGCNDKTEILKRCTRSLIKSINYAQKKIPTCNFKLNIFDDHSSKEGIKILENNISIAEFPTNLKKIKKHGLMASLRECYENMLNEGKDLVFQAQDDYLFDEVCFYEMFRQWEKFNYRFEKPLSLLPYNDPYRYWDHNIVPVRIVQGPDRHWRQTYQVPCTFMTHHSVLVNEWDLFDEICKGDPHDPKLEDKTINRLWQERNYIILSPIPSLALHFQTENEKDPYIKWEDWWNKHSDDNEPIRKNNQKLFKKNNKIVINIGCGKTKLDSQSKYFSDWQEIRVDAFENETVNLISSIVNFEGVPNESADAVWASHVLEHNYWHDLPKIFKSILRVLKPNGFAVIRVPDLGSISNKIKDGLLDVEYESSAGPVCVIDMIYGHRGFIESWGEGMLHKTGFTEKSMIQILNSLEIKSQVKSKNGEIIAILFKEEINSDLLSDPNLVI